MAVKQVTWEQNGLMTSHLENAIKGNYEKLEKKNRNNNNKKTFKCKTEFVIKIVGGKK